MIKMEIIEYYFDHGESAIGYPSASSLKLWRKKNKKSKVKHKVYKKATILNDEEKQKAVVDLVLRDTSPTILANKQNVNSVNLYEWHKNWWTNYKKEKLFV